jgi:hypothetical protein
MGIASMRERIQDAGGTGGYMMTALWTLNMLGTVTNDSRRANDEVTIEWLKNKFQLKASIETMTLLNADAAEHSWTEKNKRQWHPFSKDCQKQRRRSKQLMAKLMDTTYMRLIFKQC